MKIGYARVSTVEQNEESQIDALNVASCERIFEQIYSGKSKNRPELERMIDTLRKDDIVVVQRLDRLGRSLKNLIELMDGFKQQGVHFTKRKNRNHHCYWRTRISYDRFNCSV